MAKLEAELARQIRRQNYLAAVASERAAQADAVRHQLGAAQAEKAELEARNAALQDAIAALQNGIAELQQQIDSLHRSTSWRITQPLRNIVQWLRRGT